MLNPRDTLLAQLALKLGLVDRVGLQRAMELAPRAPGMTFDQILVRAGLLDRPGWERLIAEFRRAAAAARGQQPPPAPTPSSVLEQEADALVIPMEDEVDGLGPDSEPELAPHASAALGPPATLPAIDLPSDDEPDFGGPSEDDLYAQPTMIVADTRGMDLSDDDLYAQPTLIVPSTSAARDDMLSEAEFEAMQAQRAAKRAEEEALDEDELFAQPTMIVSDQDPGGGLSEDELLAQPTMIVKEEGGGLTDSEEEILAQPTMIMNDSTSPTRQVARPQPTLVPGRAPGGSLDRNEFQRRLKARAKFEGLKVGDYQILREIARGAFGVVLEVEPTGMAKSMATQRGYEGNLALKVMMHQSDAETERFLDEVRALIGFDHPHIVRMFDAGVEAGLTYYSMELIEGLEARQQVQRKGPLPALFAVRIVKEIASALSYVHAQKIYHRDLKPQNIMLDTTAQPYRSLLIDFGLVAEQEAKSRDKGLIMGTPSYMPPEQAQPRGGHGSINATSDIYSLGATFYFLLTGKPPFSGRDPRKIIKQVLSQPPKDPVKLNDQIPRKVADIVLRCMEKAQDDRYASARQLESDLDGFLRAGQRKLKAKALLGRFLGRRKQ
ncbi:MAG: serine/threonine-protein kinase [Planctomycetota bacterium]